MWKRSTPITLGLEELAGILHKPAVSVVSTMCVFLPWWCMVVLHVGVKVWLLLISKFVIDISN